ncbi:hypothetical protein BCR37DRAFT_166414 [Protomyces lactucae-debilis]|uniref:Uncharacterized protein n=1 Tax=Protomyces lactucae-debilis TaxID=2754530 RepID=A0A1Y2EZ52_PROLT|nr:uncharacterized protein BCR37DRAFT_166414 [Protomyces lactucae-debilis]ORY76396.1 hypothetical protein BCR37DRAFT_166414 [Protomyces lactucae-debilis]
MMVMHAKSESLSVPSPVKGHRHRRSAAISLDWRNVQLPPILDTAMLSSSAPVNIPSPAQASQPAMTFASTPADASPSSARTPCSSSSVSECSLGDHASEARPALSTQVSSAASPRKRVSFLDDVQEIPGAVEEGDTWLRPEDYTWPLMPAGPSTLNNDPLAPSIDLAPAAPTQIPGSPVLLHRKKRSSFLQTTKNVLSRRPSKSVSKKQRVHLERDNEVAPQAPLIDLDAALGPAPSLRHKRSGSLGHLPPSPVKLPGKGLGIQFTSGGMSHKRADSAPADLFFSFTPRPSTPDSRKRKMSAIVEHPGSSGSAVSTPIAAAGVVEVRMDYQFPSKPVEASLVMMGEPGDMVDSRTSVQKTRPVSALSQVMALPASPPISPPAKRKGWKGYLHRLLH